MAKKNWLKWVLLPLFVAVVVLAVELACLLPVGTLPRQEKGVLPIDLTLAQLEGGAEETDEFAEEEFYDEFAEEEYTDEFAEEAFYDEFTEEDFFEEEYAEEEFYDEEYDEELSAEDAFDEEESTPGVMKAQAGQGIVLPYTGYVQTLTITGESGSENSSYRVSCLLEDGTTWTEESFFWPMSAENAQDSVKIGKRVQQMTLVFADASFTLTAAEVDNALQMNPIRMLVAGVAAAMLFLLFVLRDTIGRRAEIGFLIVALGVGIVMCAAMPPTTGMSVDDEIHYGRIAALAHGKPGYLTEAEFTMTERGFSVVYDEAYHYEVDTLQDHRRYLAMVDKAGENAEPATDVSLQWGFSDTGYVLQAAGHALGNLLGLPLTGQITMARLFNMLSYVLLTFLGVMTLKRFKITLSAIALMPTPMFLACSLTYDTTINALCFLGLALVMDAILDRETRLTNVRALGILLCLVLGSISKVVYIPMLLLVLLLPRSKFEGNGQRIWFKTLAVILCVLTVGTMMLSVSDGAIALTDSRGDGADSAGQISYILHNPFAYLLTFFETIWTDFNYYFLDTSRTYLGYVGGMGETLSILSLVLILVAAVTDNDPSLNQKLNWKLRLAMLIIAMMAVGMTFTTMYVAYTGVGADYIAGVQGRYLIPVLPLLAMLLSPDGLHNRMCKKGWHTVFFLLNMFILLAVSWQAFGPYYAL